MKVVTVVGNRPQFIKLGVTSRCLRKMGRSAPWSSVVVNTGQHYDQMMADVFFRELEIEPPQYDLGIGSGNIIDQIGRMLNPLRQVFEAENPNGVLVYGDTNSTISGAIAAAHLDIPVIHVEGGERLYRRRHMPEEINRVVTDHLSSLCLASSAKAVRHLLREGFGSHRVRFVGDPMHDLYLLAGKMLKTGYPAVMPEDFGVAAGSFILATVHRAENTDEKDICIPLLQALDTAPLPVLLPIHPRLKLRLKTWGWAPSGSLSLVEPMGYFDFQSMLRSSAAVVTDSGGAGREAMFAGKTTIVPLESSAWSEAVDLGIATMTGNCPKRLRDALRGPFNTCDMSFLVEKSFGSGNAGELIVDAVAEFLSRDCEILRDEGWHSVAAYANAAKQVGLASRSISTFREIVKCRMSLGAKQPLLLDVTRSLRGLQSLADIALQMSGRVAIWLSPSGAEFNFLKPEVLELFVSLKERGASIYVQDDLCVPLVALTDSLPFHRSPWGQFQDISPSKNGRQWLDEIDFEDCSAPIRVRPWEWGEWPTNEFEAQLQLVDDICGRFLGQINERYFKQ